MDRWVLVSFHQFDDFRLKYFDRGTEAVPPLGRHVISRFHGERVAIEREANANVLRLSENKHGCGPSIPG
jgi:hypothetical protein